MKSHPVRIPPASSLIRRVQVGGSVVVCKSGAFTGYRLHWIAPRSSQGIEEFSEPLINGEAYVCPTGNFSEFWVTMASGIPAGTPELLELRVIDAAQPIVNLNPRRFDGWDTRKVAVAYGFTRTVAQGPATVFVDNTHSGLAEVWNSQHGAISSRGWIGGGISSATPFRATLYEGLDTGILTDFSCELGRFYVTTVDGKGRYSCNFAQVTPGGALLPWPMFGLGLVIDTNGAADITELFWILYSRTGSG